MSRAAVVYLSMIVALVGGLWAVLAVGGRLDAPEDLNGRWTALSADRGDRWSGLTVEQSGVYWQLSFDGGPQQVGLTMVDRAADGRLSLRRGPWRVTVDGAAGAAVRTFSVDGPQSGTFTGRRGRAPATTPTTTRAA